MIRYLIFWKMFPRKSNIGQKIEEKKHTVLQHLIHLYFKLLCDLILSLVNHFCSCCAKPFLLYPESENEVIKGLIVTVLKREKK